jgi:hypothetical protein
VVGEVTDDAGSIDPVRRRILRQCLHDVRRVTIDSAAPMCDLPKPRKIPLGAPRKTPGLGKGIQGPGRGFDTLVSKSGSILNPFVGESCSGA